MIGRLKTIILILVSLLMLACVPQQKASSGRRTSSKSGGTTTTTPTPTPTFSSGQSLYWYDGTAWPSTITINQNISTVFYLRGQLVHNFLSLSGNASKVYCLVVDYNDATAKKQVRTRAVPTTYNNFSTGTIERMFRLDIIEESLNTSTCSGTTYKFNSSGQSIGSVLTSESSFSAKNFCTNCSGIITGQQVSLYTASSGIGTVNYVSKTLLDLSGLILRIDTKSNTTDTTLSCSLSTCRAKGFDCCLNGQCVRDGQIKPNASAESDYSQALADVALNPSNFIKWPNIYYVCSQQVVPVPTPTPGPDSQATASAQLQQDILDYQCLEEGKKSNPDFPGTMTCGPSYDTAAYEAVRSKVWTKCGCSSDPFPTDPNNYYCPDFGLKPVKDQFGSIIEIVCDIPQPISEPTPFQELSLALSTRHAPHRFFNSSGTAIDDLQATVLAGGTLPTPEGTPFSYLDENNKSDPINVANNMNAILGQFNVELNRALPAKMVNVEYDQTYIISTTNGQYSPCPMCARDSWYASFTAFPTSNMGTGLQATSWTTQRDEYIFNSTLGNYEDTIFGRACWVPPTMLPFSHKAESSLSTQRQNRLVTQTVMYMNGYQRDWFGFNQGALIGSFDGVKWFAIGKNRRIRASTSKLYLAINAPFADLADPTNITVSILADNSNTVAPLYDYDPEYALYDPNQNQGATCQLYHQCQTDTDCVTRLGWEYMCIDVSDFRTKMPRFDIFASEKAADQIAEATITEFIEGVFPGGSRKRCVYRGSGALCKGDYTSGIKNTTPNKQKMFTCAPNFFCATVDSSNFNDEIVRNPNQLETFLYGQDADVLGRPLSYVGAGKTLPTEAQTNILSNATILLSSTADVGLCRPGKKLSTTSLISQHNDRDSSKRTDYINQIASCNSGTTGTSRVRTCPQIETRDDQTVAKGDYIFSAFNDTLLEQQNMCGKESQYNVSAGVIKSTFSQIEAASLPSQSFLLAPTVVQDACLRRAGAVCHTDLDCGPNRLHAEQASFFGVGAFGGNEAEKQYWEEYLVCGQAAERPVASNSNFFDYDMSKNRCCREISSDFTMYTQGDPEITSLNPSLNTVLFPKDGPSAAGRYSRYSSVNAVDTNTTVQSSPIAEKPMVSTATLPPKAYQWKTVHDTGELTCCGGGWVRKFADGTHDWTVTNRLNLTPQNFSCLNYENNLLFITDPMASTVHEFSGSNFYKDLDKLCLSPADGGCIERGINPDNSREVILPEALSTTTAELDTSPNDAPSSGTACVQTRSDLVPYMPVYYAPDDSNYGTTFTDYQCNNYIRDPVEFPATSIYLPIYIGGKENIISIALRYFDQDGNELGTTDLNYDPTADNTVITTGQYGLIAEDDRCVTQDDLFNSPNTVNNPSGMPINIFWCLHKDRSNNYDILSVRVPDSIPNPVLPAPPTNDDDAFTPPAGWSYAGIVVTYRVRNRNSYLYGPSPGAADTDILGSKAGNMYYYATKLARFELLGIPQIFYEPLRCNSDKSKIVDGFFELAAPTFDNFTTASLAYSNSVNGRDIDQIYANPTNFSSGSRAFTLAESNRAVYKDKVSLPDIFSGKDFTCCIKAGQPSSTADRCCSNKLADKNGEKVCAIPRGTNLYVYFNRFVSGEGTGADLPLGGLVDDDFVPESGEPKISAAVENKIRALGEALCENSKVRKGSAFGDFLGQPNNGFYQQEGSIEDSRVFGIVDSAGDFEATNDAGMAPFIEGFRWNHHLYCE